MVPSARLELAQLSPLPPQDSVSTNFTTTAWGLHLGNVRDWHPNAAREFNAKRAGFPPEIPFPSLYFVGMGAVPEVGAAGVGLEASFGAVGIAAGTAEGAASSTLFVPDGRTLPK